MGLQRMTDAMENRNKEKRQLSILLDIEERIKLEHLDSGREMSHYLTGHGPYAAKLCEQSQNNQNVNVVWRRHRNILCEII